MSEDLFYAGGLAVVQFVGPERADHGDRRRYQFTTEDEQLTISRHTWEALGSWFARYPEKWQGPNSLT
jgi:hypothetical protein